VYLLENLLPKKCALSDIYISEIIFRFFQRNNPHVYSQIPGFNSHLYLNIETLFVKLATFGKQRKRTKPSVKVRKPETCKITNVAGIVFKQKHKFSGCQHIK